MVEEWQRIQVYVNSISIYNRMERDYSILPSTTIHHPPSAIGHQRNNDCSTNTIKHGRRLMWCGGTRQCVFVVHHISNGRTQSPPSFRPKNSIVSRNQKRIPRQLWTFIPPPAADTCLSLSLSLFSTKIQLHFETISVVDTIAIDNGCHYYGI